MSIPSYMFDTMVFNRILDAQFDIGALRGKANFYATHIQYDELKNTTDPKRRDDLLLVFNDVTERKAPTESFVLNVSRLNEAKLGSGNIISTESAVWGVSKFGQAKWGEENGLYSAIKTALDVCEKKPNNIQDALIAETAIKNQLLLVTDDECLWKVFKKFGWKYINTKDLNKSAP